MISQRWHQQILKHLFIKKWKRKEAKLLDVNFKKWVYVKGKKKEKKTHSLYNKT